MTTEQIIEELTRLLARLADEGHVEESWEIQATIDRLFPVEEGA